MSRRPRLSPRREHEDTYRDAGWRQNTRPAIRVTRRGMQRWGAGPRPLSAVRDAADLPALHGGRHELQGRVNRLPGPLHDNAPAAVSEVDDAQFRPLGAVTPPASSQLDRVSTGTDGIDLRRARIRAERHRGHPPRPVRRRPDHRVRVGGRPSHAAAAGSHGQHRSEQRARPRHSYLRHDGLRSIPPASPWRSSPPDGRRQLTRDIGSRASSPPRRAAAFDLPGSAPVRHVVTRPGNTRLW